MCGGWRYCSGQDSADMCSSMQQTTIVVTAADDTCPNSMGHRSVSNLQRCIGKVMGGSGRSKCIVETVGHFWRPRKGQKICLWQIRCGAVMFLTDISQLAAELQSHVVPRNKEILPSNTSTSSWVQK